MWLCHVHNLINAKLGKAEFDCLTLDETYDCGCGDELGSTSASSSGRVLEIMTTTHAAESAVETSVLGVPENRPPGRGPEAWDIG